MLNLFSAQMGLELDDCLVEQLETVDGQEVIQSMPQAIAVSGDFGGSFANPSATAIVGPDGVAIAYPGSQESVCKNAKILTYLWPLMFAVNLHAGYSTPLAFRLSLRLQTFCALGKLEALAGIGGMAISIPKAIAQAGMGGMAFAGGSSFAVGGDVDRKKVTAQIDLETKKVSAFKSKI